MGGRKRTRKATAKNPASTSSNISQRYKRNKVPIFRHCSALVSEESDLLDARRGVAGGIAIASAEDVFNAGTHRDAIAMRWNDFVKIVNLIVGKCAEPPLDQAAEYRLSLRCRRRG
jgi:hypothetical protein